jgi:hypothetical protein
MVCFQTKNTNFREFLLGLSMEGVGIFYGHLVYLIAIWYFCGHLVYFMVIWYIYVLPRNIWQPLPAEGLQRSKGQIFPTFSCSNVNADWLQISKLSLGKPLPAELGSNHRNLDLEHSC